VKKIVLKSDGKKEEKRKKKKFKLSYVYVNAIIRAFFLWQREKVTCESETTTKAE
jgi:hypothetical protein